MIVLCSELKKHTSKNSCTCKTETSTITDDEKTIMSQFLQTAMHQMHRTEINETTAERLNRQLQTYNDIHTLGRITFI